MINKIKSFFGFGKKKLNVIQLDSADFSEDEKLRAVLNENAFLKGKLLKRKSQEGEERKREQDKKEEKEKITELNKQYVELRKDSEKPVSLFNLLKIIEKRKKTGKEILFTTFDGKEVLGTVDDFLIYPDASFGVQGIKNKIKKVIWASKGLDDVFFWTSGLPNYIKKGMIPLCLDKEGKYTPNLMEQEIPEWVKLSNDKFRINRFNKKQVYTLIQEKDEQLQEVNKELEATEEVVVEQQKEIGEKERENNLHKSRDDKIQSELSMALDKITETEKAYGTIVRENLALNNLKEVMENTIDKMENLIEKWSSKVEKEGGSSTRDKAWEDLKEIVSFAKNNLGNQTIIQEPEKEEKSLLAMHGPPRKP